jgi:hypothetical protein
VTLPFCPYSAKNGEGIHVGSLQADEARSAKWELIAGVSAKGQFVPGWAVALFYWLIF